MTALPGSNELQLNTATMIVIVQHYLDTTLLKAADVKVTDVTFDSGNRCFVIKLNPKDEQ